MLPLTDCHQRSNHTKPPLPQACPHKRSRLSAMECSAPRRDFFVGRWARLKAFPLSLPCHRIFSTAAASQRACPRAAPGRAWRVEQLRAERSPRLAERVSLLPRATSGGGLLRCAAHRLDTWLLLTPCAPGPFSRLRCSCHSPLLLCCRCVRSFIGGLRHQGRPDFARRLRSVLPEGSEADETLRIGKKNTTGRACVRGNRRGNRYL